MYCVIIQCEQSIASLDVTTLRSSAPQSQKTGVRPSRALPISTLRCPYRSADWIQSVVFMSHNGT